MDSQKATGSKGIVLMKKDKTFRRFRPRLSRFERVYLFLSDILSGAMILFDLLYLGEITQADPFILFIANLFMVSFSYVGYQIKKRARKRALRELKRLKESDVKTDKKGFDRF